MGLFSMDVVVGIILRERLKELSACCLREREWDRREGNKADWCVGERGKRRLIIWGVFFLKKIKLFVSNRKSARLGSWKIYDDFHWELAEGWKLTAKGSMYNIWDFLFYGECFSDESPWQWVIYIKWFF